MSLADPLRRHRTALRWGVLAALAVGALLLLRALPVAQGVERLRGWIDGLGALGPLAFGALYVIAVLCLVPGAAITLAAGGLFGLAGGFVLVSVASTAAAALAFLAARHLARERVERLARRHPRFDAVDRAVGEGGWKTVVLLRLSPIVPYSVANWLFGLTAVRFGPYVLASWAGMLPGTFLYVYLGHVGRAGLAASGQGGERTPGEWALLGVGLLATLAVTILVTRRARRALAEHEDRGG